MVQTHDVFVCIQIRKRKIVANSTWLSLLHQHLCLFFVLTDVASKGANSTA